MIPGATYRVQLHAGFSFEDAAAVVPYLARLGVTQLYCSPCLQAAPGSTHGYDVVDPGRLSDELGGSAGYRRLVAALHRGGLGQVLDIVPNHMAVAGRANRWWWDVLENGPASVYAGCFDIDWEGGEAGNDPTVLVPVLGEPYGRAVDAGELRVERQGGSFVVRYGEHEVPLSPRTLDAVLEPAERRLPGAALATLLRMARSLPDARSRDPEAARERHRRKEELREQLGALCERDESAAKAIDAEVDALNADPDRLDALLRRQNYRLAWWRTASEELNYRRFFNIESLVGLRVEREAVFADTHRLILSLVRDGAVDGLRVDHVDGLRDPAGYLERLRAASGGVYTVVEKILEAGEELPAWPVEGTTGYDFLTRVGNLFVDAGNEAAMTACYERFTGESASWRDVVHAAKRHVMDGGLRAEVDALTRRLAAACDGHRRHRDHTRRELREARVEFVAAFPVYRTYVQPGSPASGADRRELERAVREAGRRRPDLDAELLAFLGELASMEHAGADETEFALRLPQLSAPVMAKGVEDTAFYRYHRLVSLNEVGGDPGVFGRPTGDFHRETERAARRWPGSMLALSTHDTKRSADVRARVHLLSEIPGAFEEAVARLSEAGDRYRRGDWPDRNAQYLLYQTLVGAWPIGVERVCAFMEKAVREAKVHTSWVDPAPDYEDALQAFVRAVLADSAFVSHLEDFVGAHRLVELGRVTSLAQTALLLTCPGVPDLYQGSELWDLSLVDPDNRRPVNYDERARLLGTLPASPPAELATDHVGAAKLWLVSRLLSHRRRRPATYASADYEPLAATGPKAEHAVAFTRGDLAVVVPRLVLRLSGDWAGTRIALPAGGWTDVLTGAPSEGGSVPVAGLLAGFPVAVLCRGPA